MGIIVVFVCGAIDMCRLTKPLCEQDVVGCCVTMSGMAGCGVMWRRLVWRRRSDVRLSGVTGCGVVWRSMVWRGMAGCGVGLCGVARCDVTRSGVAGCSVVWFVGRQGATMSDMSGCGGVC